MSGEEKDEIAAVAPPFAKASVFAKAPPDRSGDKSLPRKDRVGGAEDVGKNCV
jgi:hypothetical protein